MSDEINEITEEHSDYKPADARDESVKHQLTGMYQNWFLDYASYVILERAVPHINDGLKPVQRRILHSMKRLDDGRYNKVANIVGHTMQFHPHGDASIGDALVQLGQKDLLIDCQGNWGNILTGDGAAAPRYIEARLSKFALDVVFNPKTTEWKFCLPAGFQTTTKFSHLHQLKGIDNSSGTADVGSPLITLTAYSNSKGGQQLRVRYDKRGEGTTTLASTDLADFLGNWVEVEEKACFGENGSYEVTITRIKDGKVLLKLGPEKMDMWRTDCTGLRPKWGIYRYLGENRSWQDQLRDEEIRFADFSIKKL